MVTLDERLRTTINPLLSVLDAMGTGDFLELVMLSRETLVQAADAASVHSEGHAAGNACPVSRRTATIAMGTATPERSTNRPMLMLSNAGGTK